ncbi:hypothetical protein [Nonomuraea sp. NPDC050310]|uniref:hypothetical protein n=1 Tax=Nonomuraea sp. NPDC050310 TaxID=3154935 RepID=UPI0033F226E3
MRDDGVVEAHVDRDQIDSRLVRRLSVTSTTIASSLKPRPLGVLGEPWGRVHFVIDEYLDGEIEPTITPAGIVVPLPPLLMRVDLQLDIEDLGSGITRFYYQPKVRIGPDRPLPWL